jgi:hypothetical protein
METFNDLSKMDCHGLEAQFLADYLVLDTWSAREALCLIRRLDPKTTKLVWPEGLDDPTASVSITEYVPDRRVTIYEAKDSTVSFNHTRIIVKEPRCDPRMPNSDASEGQEDLWFEEIELERLRRQWYSQTKQLANRLPPQVYIQWALQQQIDIAWLGWATNEGFYNPPSVLEANNVNADDKPLAPKTKIGLLRLIAALLVDVIDDVQKSDSAVKGINHIQGKLHRVGLHIDKDTIANYVRDALEQKRKDLEKSAQAAKKLQVTHEKINS